MSIRKCEIAQQIKFLPGYPDWKKPLEKSLAEHDSEIKTWAYILHDKDVAADGSAKEPHIHLVIELTESLQVGTVGNWFGVPGQYICRIKQRIPVGTRWVSDIGGALSYLTHRNAPDKYQYHDSDVVAKPGYDWIAARTKSEMGQAAYKSFKKIIEQIGDGTIRRYNLYDHIDMQTYIAHKAEVERAFDYRDGKVKKDSNRKIDVVYITGCSGSGKTTLAKYYCDKHGYSYCISGSSRDPLQDYAGQDAIILDDLRPNVFPFADLLKLLDNHSASSASARYHDKWLEATTIIITSVLSIDDFYLEIKDKEREPIEQLKRRCKTLFVLTPDIVDVYVYNHSIKDYTLQGHGKNPVADMFAPDERDATVEEIKSVCATLGIQYAPEGLPCDYDNFDELTSKTG